MTMEADAVCTKRHLHSTHMFALTCGEGRALVVLVMVVVVGREGGESSSGGGPGVAVGGRGDLGRLW